MIPFRLSFSLFAHSLQKDTNSEHIAMLSGFTQVNDEEIKKTDFSLKRNFSEICLEND